jgi:hypothetical protein
MMWRWDPHVREEKKKKKIKETLDVVAQRARARARAGLACSFEQLRWCPALLFFFYFFSSLFHFLI